MCLMLEIELPLEFSRGTISARRLSRETGLHVHGHRTKDGHRRFHFARGKTCSCSLLADESKLLASEWLLEPDAGEALAKVVALIAAIVPSFTLHSEWNGMDRDPVQVSIPVTQLLEELRANRLRAHAAMQVRSDA